MAVTIDSIMKPVFGTPTGTGVLPTGGMATQTPMPKTLRVFGVALVLVDEDEAARIDQPVDAADGRRRRGRPEASWKRQRAVRGSTFGLPASSTSSTCIIAGSTDVTLALVTHLMWRSRISLSSKRLGVADPVEAEMADIGLGGDEGHGHAVADLAAAQLGIEDEGELVGRAEAGGALHGADDDGAGVLAEGLERAARCSA